MLIRRTKSMNKSSQPPETGRGRSGAYDHSPLPVSVVLGCEKQGGTPRLANPPPLVSDASDGSTASPYHICAYYFTVFFSLYVKSWYGPVRGVREFTHGSDGTLRRA